MSPPQSLIENVPSPMALGIVGSTAYGLDTPDSDVDRLGVYVESTEKFLGLNPPSRERATIVRHNDDGDVQWHEAGKFVGLVLSGNPTVSELLWLPERCYEIRNAYFEMLRPLRHRLLCADGVRNAYFGYASQQFKRLVERGRFGGSDETRREKHARHLLRLVDQGLYAYEHGEIVVEVDDPERYHAFGQACRDSTEPARRALAEAEQRFDTITTPLPQYPDRDVADTWLRMVRFAYLEVPA